MSTNGYRFRIGNFECVAVSDGTWGVGANILFANAPEEELTAIIHAYNLQPEDIPVSETCLAIDTGDHQILVDTGIGIGVGVQTGHLLRNLQAEGIHPNDIHIVILSHGHPDHIGGITDTQGDIAFPNARYVMWKDEWNFWTSEENLSQVDESWARFARKNLPPIQDRLELIEQDREVLPGIYAIFAPGHTPGHMGLEISSAGEKLLYLADAVLHPIQLEHPDWYAVVDSNPEQVVATRYRLLERAAAENTLVLVFHFAFPGLGFIIPKGNRWQWQPIQAE